MAQVVSTYLASTELWVQTPIVREKKKIQWLPNSGAIFKTLCHLPQILFLASPSSPKHKTLFWFLVSFAPATQHYLCFLLCHIPSGLQYFTYAFPFIWTASFFLFNQNYPSSLNTELSCQLLYQAFLTLPNWINAFFKFPEHFVFPFSMASL
jgi:hypothetical protein